MTTRRKKNEQSNPVVAFVFSALGLIILALTVIGLLALYGTWIYFELRARKNPTTINDIATTHTVKEKVEMHDLKNELEGLRADFERLKKIADGCSRRNDGAFDARSATGKMLNIEWPRTEKGIQFRLRELSRLENAPDIRTDEFISLRSSLYATRFSAMAYPVIATVVVFMKQDGAQAVSKIIEKNTGGALFGVEALYGSLTTSLLITAVIFVIIKMMTTIKLKKEVNKLLSTST